MGGNGWNTPKIAPASQQAGPLPVRPPREKEEALLSAGADHCMMIARSPTAKALEERTMLQSAHAGDRIFI